MDCYFKQEVDIDSIESKVSNKMGSFVTSAIKSSGLDKYFFFKTGETAQWLLDEVSRWLSNVDWNWEGTDREQEIDIMFDSIKGSLDYWIDKDFGYDEDDSRPKNKGEELARKLIEPFERQKDEMLSKIKTREQDYAKAKRILHDMFDIGKEETKRLLIK